VRANTLLALALSTTLWCGGARTQSSPNFSSDGPGNQSEPAKVSAVHYLVPVLVSAGTGAIISYRGVCGVPGSIPFPKLKVHAPSDNATGLEAIKEIYQGNENVRVALGSDGVFRIDIGAFPKRILKARLAQVSFDRDAQFDSLSAILDLMNADYFQMAEKRLKVYRPTEIVDILTSGPGPGRPHLPVTLRNMTVEQILGVMAKTWKGIALYGVSCDDPKEYDIWYTGGIDYDDRGDWHSPAKN
jgi:hypothetical protein